MGEVMARTNQKCKSCIYYRPLPIVKMEGECNDSTKIIYVNDKTTNNRPQVFEFSSCSNHVNKEG